MISTVAKVFKQNYFFREKLGRFKTKVNYISKSFEDSIVDILLGLRIR